jgi:superoxide reductase
MKEPKFFICQLCGNLVENIVFSGVVMECCGQPMNELTANTVDASQEKHVPVIEQAGNIVKVKVGSVPHPMMPEHYIPWIYLKTDKGVQRKHLTPTDKPETEFVLSEGEKVVSAYEYCNLHSLWKKDI